MFIARKHTLALVVWLGLLGVSQGALTESRTTPSARPLQPYRLNLAAPKLEGRLEDWLNTGGKRLQFERGQVYVVHFWTFGCVNCQHNLPAYARWQKQFARQNLTIVGVHTPETENEKSAARVREQVRQLGITYPVLLDLQQVNWKRWQQSLWPAVYLVDKRGHVRYRWLGELESPHPGGEERMARCLEDLLAEPPNQGGLPNEKSARQDPGDRQDRPRSSVLSVRSVPLGARSSTARRL